MNTILNWFDERTGYRKFVHDGLYENIPGGARWRYVWGSTLVFTFSVQVITGLFLWMAYSPGSQTAWESVYYIQHEMQFGWLLRGIHHYAAQLMIVLMALHLMQVIIDGAYKAPREVNFWLGLILMQIVLGLSLTGYLLPWDQKGYWATQVATSLSAIVPAVGPAIQRLVVGGSNYGHHTLTRFFAMHAGVLPALLIGFLVLHIYVFRRHGITTKDAENKPVGTFWPDQVLKDAVACLGVLMVVLLLVFQNAPRHSFDEWQTLAQEGRLGEDLGADLGSPAEPTESYSAARPEWYFLFLFQFLKYFPAESEILGAIIIPGAVLMVMFMMPFIGRWKKGHLFNVGYMGCLLVGVALLTYLAIDADSQNDDYAVAVEGAEKRAKRTIELIQGPSGIGSSGALALLRNDPKTQGPKVFATNCSVCHRYNGHDGNNVIPKDLATASDLGEFGTRIWIRGFITNPAGPNHFGPTVNGKFKGEAIGDRFVNGQMAQWVADNVSKMTKRQIDGVVEFLLAQGDRDEITPDPELVAVGRDFFIKGDGSEDAAKCADCHFMKVGDDELGEEGLGAPDLTGYASEEWLRDILLNPGAEQHYGDNNAMPSYKGRVSEKDLGILLRWMRHRWYEPDNGLTTVE